MKKIHKLAIAAGCIIIGISVSFSISYRAGRGYTIDNNAEDGEYIGDGVVNMDVLQAQADKPGFRIQINGEPTVSKDTQKGNFMIGNPEENTKNTQVVIMLDKTGDIVYTSPVLQPGERNVYGTITQKLAQGEYPATAVFQMMDEKTDEIMGQLEAGITLIVN